MLNGGQEIPGESRPPLRASVVVIEDGANDAGRPNNPRNDY